MIVTANSIQLGDLQSSLLVSALVGLENDKYTYVEKYDERVAYIPRFYICKLRLHRRILIEKKANKFICGVALGISFPWSFSLQALLCLDFF